MIRYALICDGGHGFDSWFPSSDSYDAQRKRKLVSCPACGSMSVKKQIMAPAVQGVRERPAPAPTAPSEPVSMTNDTSAKLRELVRQLHQDVQARTEDVGHRFADEARAMHYGDKEERAIRGTASAEEAKALFDEGIDVQALPPLPDDRN